MLLKVRQNRGPTPRNVTENDELTLPDILNSIRMHKTAVQFGDTRIALGMSGTSDSHRKCPQHQERAVRVAAGSFLWKLAVRHERDEPPDCDRIGQESRRMICCTEAGVRGGLS